MASKEILASLTEVGIVPVVRCSSAEGAVETVAALYRGGIRAAEITMTVPGAVRALEKAADRFGGEMVLGAGTVLDPETARICMLAGAEFFVTPTEVLAAWEAGADAVKIFPCGNVGGAKYIKALKGPFPHIEMIPTGGVNLETIGDFLKAGSCACGVGGELVDGQSVAQGRFDVIEDRARKYLAAIAQARNEMKGAAKA